MMYILYCNNFNNISCRINWYCNWGFPGTCDKRSTERQLIDSTTQFRLIQKLGKLRGGKWGPTCVVFTHCALCNLPLYCSIAIFYSGMSGNHFLQFGTVTEKGELHSCRIGQEPENLNSYPAVWDRNGKTLKFFSSSCIWVWEQEISNITPKIFNYAIYINF